MSEIAYLFIGGPVDGQMMKPRGNPHQVHTAPPFIPWTSASPKGIHPDEISQRPIVHEYAKRNLIGNTKVVSVFALTSMTDDDILEALIANYKPTK